MKLSLIGPVYPYRGGIAHYTASLAEALSKKHTVQVISFKRQYPSWLYPGKSDRDPSQTPIETNAEFILDPILPQTWRRGAVQIQEHKSEGAIIQWWTTFWGPAFGFLVCSLRRRSIPVVFLIHNVLPHEGRPWDPFLVRSVLSQGSGFIVQSSRELDRLKALLPESKAFVCPHPVYNVFSNQKIEKKEARRRLGISENEPLLLFFGIVRPYKGLQPLLNAVAMLKNAGKPVTLIVAGEIWGDRQAYNESVQKFHLEKQVRFEDRYIPNEEVPLYFSAADAFVAPYIDGTQSGALKIALGFDVPVVASQAIVESELVNQYEKLYVVEPGNVEQLARAILTGIEKAPQTKSEHDQPRSTTWEDMVETIEIALRFEANSKEQRLG